MSSSILSRSSTGVKNFLPERALWHIAALMDAFPTVSLELYHEDDLVQVMRPRAWNDQHAKLTGLGYEVIEAVTAETAPPPFAKALFGGPPRPSSSGRPPGSGGSPEPPHRCR